MGFRQCAGWAGRVPVAHVVGTTVTGGAMLTYDPILAAGERFRSGLITGSLISAELWLGAFLLLRAILY